MLIQIIKKQEIAKNIFLFQTTKPKEYSYVSGQACLLTYKNLQRPFTLTSIPEDNFLEFIIKIYDEHNGFTKNLREIKINEEIEITFAFGKMRYFKSGLFLAGGTGITPFISIFKSLPIDEIKKSKLIYSVNYKDEIILENFLKEKFDDNLIITTTKKKCENYLNQLIDKELISKNLKEYEYVYLCGTPSFNFTMKNILKEIKIKEEKIIE
jgi:predicted ferric reductase